MKIGYTISHLLANIFTCSLYVAYHVGTACPPEPYAKVQNCTADIIPNMSIRKEFEKEEWKTQVKLASDTCKNSRLRDVATCIEDILDNCRGTTDEELTMHRIIDKESTIKTVDYFCQHISVYQKHAECIGGHHKETSICTNDAHNSYRANVNTGANIDSLLINSCRFHSVARGCLANTTQMYCGSEAAHFVYKIITGSMPPYCKIHNPEYDPVHTTSRWNSDSYNNHASTISSVLITIVFAVEISFHL